MSYCDNCILLDICGKEGCCDEAMTFCADKHRFIYKSVFEDIKAEISKLQIYKLFEDTEKLVALDEVLQIIDKHMRGTENESSD